MRLAFVALSGAALCLGGCASVVRGTDETLALLSDPPGASVVLSDGLRCAATPCSIVVPRKEEFTATFSKPGYRPQTVQVISRVGGEGVAAGAGNILVGGVIGVGVDAYNGANLDHSPNPVTVTLQRIPTAPATRGRPPQS